MKINDIDPGLYTSYKPLQDDDFRGDGPEAPEIRESESAVGTVDSQSSGVGYSMEP